MDNAKARAAGLDKVRKLIELAADPGSTIDEARNAGRIACQWIKTNGFLVIDPVASSQRIGDAAVRMVVADAVDLVDTWKKHNAKPRRRARRRDK